MPFISLVRLAGSSDSRITGTFLEDVLISDLLGPLSKRLTLRVHAFPSIDIGPVLILFCIERSKRPAAGWAVPVAHEQLPDAAI